MGSVVLSLNSIAHFILHPAENSQLGLGALQVEPVCISSGVYLLEAASRKRPISA